MGETPALYDELAGWWPLVSAPEDHAEEAAEYERILLETADGEVRTVLELGSGGGNNASHLKRRFRITLVDRSPDMLAVSRALNPGCEHIEGDMRSDTTYVVDFAFLLRLPDASLDVRRDRHVGGLFPRQTWLDLLEGAGFEPHVRSPGHEGPEGSEAFAGRRR